MFTVFFALRLGSVLRINDQVFDVLLAQILSRQTVPRFFKLFTRLTIFRWVLLPLAVMSCYGLKVDLIRCVPNIVHTARWFSCASHLSPLSTICLPPDQKLSPYATQHLISWLQAQDDHDSIRLINLPMGRKSSKLYNFYQSLNGFPQVEGMISRTPASAYDYIESNTLLNSWRDWQRYRCTAPNSDYVSVRRG